MYSQIAIHLCINSTIPIGSLSINSPITIASLSLCIYSTIPIGSLSINSPITIDTLCIYSTIPIGTNCHFL